MGEVTRTRENVSERDAQRAFNYAYDSGAEAVVIVKDGKKMTIREMIEQFRPSKIDLAVSPRTADVSAGRYARRMEDKLSERDPDGRDPNGSHAIP